MVAPIGRVQTILTGFVGAPGLIQMYWNGAAPGAFTTTDASAAVAATYAFMVAVRTAFAGSVGMQVQPNVETFEATTGALIGVVAATPVAATNGTATGTVTVAQGALVQWLTSDVVGRRLLRGRSFLTPGAASTYVSAGSILPAVSAAIIAAGNVLLATVGPSLVVWHRPVPFATGGNGSASEVVAVGSPATAAVLRSRRD